jgi:hypothetical protein
MPGFIVSVNDPFEAPAWRRQWVQQIGYATLRIRKFAWRVAGHLTRGSEIRSASGERMCVKWPGALFTHPG